MLLTLAGVPSIASAKWVVVVKNDKTYEVKTYHPDAKTDKLPKPISSKVSHPRSG